MQTGNSSNNGAQLQQQQQQRRTPDAPPSGPTVYSLYIADIHPSLTESDLLDLLAKAGTVLSIHLVRDRLTRVPLGYGYVNYERAAEAERALKEHNYTVIGGTGQQLRLMWSRRSRPAWPPAGNVFVKNLAPTITSATLHWVFEHFGEVLAAKVAPLDQDQENGGGGGGGISKRYGFVQFAEEGAAEQAIHVLNRSIIDGSQVYVGRWLPKAERLALAEGGGGGGGGGASPQRTTAAHNHCTLYVKNLGSRLDSDAKLGAFFSSKCEGMVSASVAIDQATRQSKGFGFVTFSSSEQAERAMSELNGTKMGEEVNGKELLLYVAPLQRKAEREVVRRRLLEQRKEAREQGRLKGVNLYVKNLDPAVDDGRLKAAFAPFGTITSAKVARTEPTTEGAEVRTADGQVGLQKRIISPGGQSRGFGFVCFSRPEEATKARAELNNKVIAGLSDSTSGAQRPLYVGVAQTKADREAWKVRMRYGGGWAQGRVIHSRGTTGQQEGPNNLNMPSMISVFAGEAGPQPGQQQQQIPLPYLAHGMAQLSVVLNVHPFTSANLGPAPVRYADGLLPNSLSEQGLLPPGYQISRSGEIVYDGRRRFADDVGGGVTLAGRHHVRGAPTRPIL